MKQLLWLSLVLLTAFWLFAVDIYGITSSPVPAITWLIVGIAISIFVFSRTEAVSSNGFKFVLLPFVPSCFVIPYPYNVGPIITFAAILVSLIAPKLRMIWVGLFYTGAVLIVQSLALLIYYIFAPNYHETGWLASLLAYISSLTGLEATSSNGMVLVSAQQNVFPFTVTLEKLGFYPWILIFMGSVIIIFLTSRNASISLKRILNILILSFVYLLLRYVILVHIFFSRDIPEFAGERMNIFIDPWWLIVSFVPLMLLYLWLYPVENLNFNFGLIIDRRLAVAFVAISVSVFCLAGAAIFQDPGVKKDGRVLVDEIHSLWETSTFKLDKDWYGERSTYNAYSMVEWLNDTHKVDRVVSPSFKNSNIAGAKKVLPNLVSDNLTYDILKNYDILIIKTPTHYESNEIEAIVRFVENGGGLFLIGDHTNFAGTGTNLNQISKRFGIEFGFDSVNTINGSLYHYNRGQLPHPIVKYMPTLDFMTGCSLRAPLGGEPAILGFGMEAFPGEYASEGFFRETRNGDPTQVTDTEWGLMNQAVAVKYGKGRVVAFADSTIISNFRVFFGGTPNLIIGVMEYLDLKNSNENERQILFLLGLILAVIAAYLLGRMTWGERKIAALVLILALGVLSASGAVLLFSTKVGGSIPSNFYERNHTVSFDGEHSDHIVSQGNKIGQYENFYIWTQRVNLTPSLDNRLEEGMAKGRMVVIIDPTIPLSMDEQNVLMNYVMDGNSVLLMMSSRGPWSYVTSHFGLETYNIKEPYNGSWIAKNGLPIMPWGLAVKGGKALLTIDGRVVLAEADYGKGRFVLFTDSQVFKNGFYGNPGYMGNYMSDPEIVDKTKYDLKALYDLEYSIFEDYLEPQRIRS